MKKLVSTLFFCICSVAVIPTAPMESAIPEEKRIDSSIPTRGKIDLLRVENDYLHIAGRSCCLEVGQSIDAFRIEFDNQFFFVEAMDNFSRTSQTFEAYLPVSESAYYTPYLVKVTPIIGEQEGLSIYKVFNCELPIPSQSDVDIVGGGDLMEISNELLGIMIERSGLRSTDDVLDVGCGLGRVAYSLAYYLDKEAKYSGFDIMPNLINLAQTNVTPWFPNFNFIHANIYNGLYNRQGTIRSSSYRFPYPDKSFDFVVLTSVFTHMLPRDLCHYLDEIYRVLKPGGTCMMTCFLLNNDSRRLLSLGQSTIPFDSPLIDCYVSVPSVPEAAVAYDMQKISRWINDRGLKVHNYFPGSWCGRSHDFTSFQDILLLKK